MITHAILRRLFFSVFFYFHLSVSLQVQTIATDISFQSNHHFSLIYAPFLRLFSRFFIVTMLLWLCFIVRACVPRWLTLRYAYAHTINIRFFYYLCCIKICRTKNNSPICITQPIVTAEKNPSSTKSYGTD